MLECFVWDSDKNEQLKNERGVSFEEIVYMMDSGGLVGVLEHPNSKKYKNQRLFCVLIRDYLYVVPYLEADGVYILKTAFPSRKMKKIFDRR